MNTTVISLGGSIIVPDKIDVPFLKKLKTTILSHIKKGNRVVLVCGGGSVCRTYQKAATKLTCHICRLFNRFSKKRINTKRDKD